MKRSVERTRVQQEPHLVWNAFVDLLAVEDYANLSPLQRKAHLVFWYDSEVQNGGHGQYLENSGCERLPETVQALIEFGLPAQAKLLSRVVSALSRHDDDVDWTEVLDDDLIDKLDDAYHRCTPTITDALERHLAEHCADYVEQT